MNKIFTFYDVKIIQILNKDKQSVLLKWKHQKKPLKFTVYRKCWECDDRALTHNGYPHIQFRRKTYRVNRFMYCLFNGLLFEDIKNKIILHSCDNRLCCNPDHLTCGVHIENMADMVRKERSARGERNGSAMLSKNAVALIRSADNIMPNSYYADMFGVSESAIGRIKRGETWKHVI